MSNVIVSSITRTPVDQGGGVWGGLGAGTVTPPSGDWQLPAANYEDAHTAAELIHPRPDSETPVWAKHRRHYPGIKYEIPVGVSFGSWPFYFELITAPSGMTIGSFLVVSGDNLVAPDNYGVVAWDSPTVGNHTISVRVSFQDGATPIVVTWNLEVTTTGTIFVDDVSGNDSTGTGLIGAPFKTIDGWFKADYTNTDFSQYQVCYKAGTYSVETADPVTASYKELRMNWWNKPLVHYAHNNELAVWDFTSWMTFGYVAGSNPGSEENMSDWFLGGIKCIGGNQVDSGSRGGRRWKVNAACSGPFIYDGSGGGNRATWFNSPQSDWEYTGNPNDNAAICFGGSIGDGTKRRTYFYVSRCDISNITHTVSNPNFNGWYVGQSSYFLVENLSTEGNDFEKSAFVSKSSEYKSCFRNLDMSQDINQGIKYDNAGSYAPLIGGGSEISYCKVNDRRGYSEATAIQSGHSQISYDPEEANHLGNYHFRNSASKAPTTTGHAFNAFDNWPVEVFNDIWCSQGDGALLAPANTKLVGGWEIYAVASNPFDSNMNLAGIARTTYLGLKGAEVSF